MITCLVLKSKTIFFFFCFRFRLSASESGFFLSSSLSPLLPLSLLLSLCLFHSLNNELRVIQHQLLLHRGSTKQNKRKENKITNNSQRCKNIIERTRRAMIQQTLLAEFFIENTSVKS